jgi:hypothetical protein
MRNLCMVVTCCLLVSGCAQTAAIYNMPRFGPDGDIYMLKLEGEEAKLQGTDPLPATERIFPGDKVIAIDPEDGAERHILAWSEIEWYRTATEGQWRFGEKISEDAASFEEDVEYDFQEILSKMRNRQVAREIRGATHFRDRQGGWTYRVYDISADDRYIVAEDHGSVIIFDTGDGWRRLLGRYRPYDDGGDWLKENGGNVVIGLLVVGIITAIIISATKSGHRHNGHRGHRGHHGHRRRHSRHHFSAISADG